MKKILKVTSVFICLVLVFSLFTSVYADSSLLNTIFDKGGNFFKNNINDTDAKSDANLFVNELTATGGIVDTIKTIGYLIFFISGAALGIRYMVSGVEGKTLVKNGLISYCLGAAFFYLADQIFTFFYNIFKSDISSATSYTTIQGRIWATFSNVASVIIVAIVIIYGLKYMWANSENRSRLKQGLVPMLVGAILIMCTLQILKFIVNTTSQTIGNNNTYEISYVLQEDIRMPKYYIK